MATKILTETQSIIDYTGWSRGKFSNDVYINYTSFVSVSIKNLNHNLAMKQKRHIKIKTKENIHISWSYARRLKLKLNIAHPIKKSDTDWYCPSIMRFLFRTDLFIYLFIYLLIYLTRYVKSKISNNIYKIYKFMLFKWFLLD